MLEPINNRYEFVLLVEVKNGNPNGDPDAGNSPRIDPETGKGIITDVCIKRKIRNYVALTRNNEEHNQIYVREGIPLDENRKRAYDVTGIPVPEKKTEAPSQKKEYDRIVKFMTQNFYDIRAFGAVMTLSYNCGQVKGPVQINFGESIDPVYPRDITITSCTYANANEEKSKIGKKSIIPYGLYRFEGYVSACVAKDKSGFSEDDLALLWEAIINMFDVDHSAARGKMTTRKLIVFKHDSELGNCPSHKLFDLIDVKRKDDVEVARKFSDYDISINQKALPNGVELIEMC